jgi:hypothetical protein
MIDALLDTLNNLTTQTWFWVLVALIVMYFVEDQLLTYETYGSSDGLGELSMDQWDLRKKQQGK